MITSSSLYAMFSLSFIISRRLLQQEFWSSSDQLHELHSEAPPIWLYRPSFAYSRLIVPRRLSIQHQCCKTKPQIRAINQAIKSSMPNTTINVKHGTVPQGYLLVSMRISNALKKKINFQFRFGFLFCATQFHPQTLENSHTCS